MKKFFTFLVTALISLVAFNASAYNLTFYATADGCVTNTNTGTVLTTTPVTLSISAAVNFEFSGAKLVQINRYDKATGEAKGQVTFFVPSGASDPTTSTNGKMYIQLYNLGVTFGSDPEPYKFEIVVEKEEAPKPTKEIKMYATEEGCVTFTQNGVEYTLTKTPTVYPIYTQYLDFEVKGAKFNALNQYENSPYPDEKSVTDLGDNKYQVYAGILWPSATYEFDVTKEEEEEWYTGVKVVGANPGDTEHFTVNANYSDISLVDGVYGPFEYQSWANIKIQAKEGYILTSVIDPYSGKEFSLSYDKKYVYVSESDLSNAPMYKLVVSIANLSELRTASFDVTVDGDADDVLFRRYSDYAYLDLTSNGTTTIKFIPDSEDGYSISSMSSKAFYEVKLNEKPVEFSGGSYAIKVKDGDKVYINTVFPDLPATIKLDGVIDAISSIQVNNKEALTQEARNAGEIACKLGDYIYVQFDRTNYDFQAENSNVTLNDKTFNVWGSSFTTTEQEYTLSVTVSVKNPKNISITAADYENLDVYTTEEQVANRLKLTGETTQFQLRNDISTLVVVAPEGFEISSILVNDNEILSEGKQTKVIIPSITDGSSIIIKNVEKTDALLIVYNQPAPVGEDQQDYLQYYALNAAGANKVLMSESIPGYTQYEVAKKWSPMYVEFEAKDEAYVYLNGEQLDLMMGMAAQFDLTEEVSVLKVFYREPETYTAKFYVDNDQVTVTAITDRNASAAEDVKNRMTKDVLEGSEIQFSILSTARAAHNVMVNNVEITPNDEGMYTVIVNGPTVIDIDDASTRVDSIGSETMSEETIYNLQGVRISNVKELPAGIYVINGKKVVKK